MVVKNDKVYKWPNNIICMNRRNMLKAAALLAGGLAAAGAEHKTHFLKNTYYHSILNQSTPEEFEHFISLAADWAEAHNNYFSRNPTVSKQEVIAKKRKMHRWLKPRIPEVNFHNTEYSIQGFEKHGYVFYPHKRNRQITLGELADLEFENKKLDKRMNEEYEGKEYDILLFRPLSESRARDTMFSPDPDMGVKRVYVNLDLLEKEAGNLYDICKKHRDSANCELFRQNKNRQAFVWDYGNELIRVIGGFHEPAHLFDGYNETGADLVTLEKAPLKESPLGNYIAQNIFIYNAGVRELFERHGHPVRDLSKIALDEISKTAGYIHKKTPENELRD